MKNQKSVLIVDDEADFAEGLAFLLDAEGFRSSTATSGHSLLERLKSERPDLILLDVMMPAYNGLEVVVALRGNKQYKEIPVILMSASKEPIERPKYWSDFLSKPADLSELLGKVQKALSVRPMAQGPSDAG